MKIKRHNRLLAPLTLALTIVLGACSSIDCSIDNIVQMNVGISDSLHNDSLYVYARIAGNDTLILNRGHNLPSVPLDMTFSQDVDTYIFEFTDSNSTTIVDTISIAKTNEPHFESVDCTPQFWHTIQGVTTTHNRLDSITINNNVIDNDPSKQHIILHMHRR